MENSADSIISMILAAYGIAINYISARPEWEPGCLQESNLFNNKPGNVDIYSNEESQIELIKLRNDVLKWMDDAKSRFTSGRERSFIDSFGNKSWQEIAIYSAATSISYQCLDFTLAVLDETGKTWGELVAIAFDGSSSDGVSSQFYSLIPASSKISTI